ISRRGEQFRIEGPISAANQALSVLEALYARAAKAIAPEQVQLALANQGVTETAEGPVLSTRRSDLQGRTHNQVLYLRNILAHDLTFGIGPAGTGKTDR